MNVLGVQFDTKLNWLNQANNCMKNERVAFHALRLIKGYPTLPALKQLITLNFYSILCYKTPFYKISTCCLSSINKTLNPNFQQINVLLHCIQSMPEQHPHK
jgi:hypothetical protein